MRRQLEGTQVKFFRRRIGGLALDVRHLDECEDRLRKLLPDRKILSRYREVAERKHVSAGLGDVPCLLPGDLVDQRLSLVSREQAPRSHMGRGTLASRISSRPKPALPRLAAGLS